MDFGYEDIWDTLGIPPGSDVSAVRKAYSEKAKDCHPEDNPDGFMRLRSAYKAAIQLSSTKVAPPLAYGGQEADSRQDFSRKRAEEPIVPLEQKTAPPAFDFSDVCAETSVPPPEPGVEASAFDFSTVDEVADELAEEEMQMADEIIARLIKLYKSRLRRHSSKWRDILNQPDVKRLQKSEYFTWAFLDFIAMYIQIPYDVRTSVIDPFLYDWRDNCRGTEMWNEFDIAEMQVARQKESIAASMAGRQIVLLVIGGMVSLATAFIVARLVSAQMLIPDVPNAVAVQHLIDQYRTGLFRAILFIATPVIWFIMQGIYCLRVNAISKGYEKEYGVDPYTGAPEEKVRGVLLLFFAILIVAAYTELPNLRNEVSAPRDEIAQILEERDYTESSVSREIPRRAIQLPERAQELMREQHRAEQSATPNDE